MNIDKLKSFCTIVEKGSFSAAAATLYCSQAAISKQMKALEAELGFTLFDRYGKKLTLNSNGKIVYRYGQKITSEILEMQKTLYEENRNNQQIIAFGATNFIGSHIITPKLSKFKILHPDTAISFTIDFITNIMQLLLIDQFNFIFASECSTLTNHPGIIAEHFCDDKLAFIVTPNHKWHNRSTITAAEITTEIFLVSQPNSATRKFIEQQFKQLGLTLQKTQNFYNIENIKQYLLTGTGVSILPRNLIDNELRNQLLIEIPVSDLSLDRKIFVVYKKNRQLAPIEKKFIKFFY